MLLLFKATSSISRKRSLAQTSSPSSPSSSPTKMPMLYQSSSSSRQTVLSSFFSSPRGHARSLSFYPATSTSPFRSLLFSYFRSSDLSNDLNAQNTTSADLNSVQVAEETDDNPDDSFSITEDEDNDDEDNDDQSSQANSSPTLQETSSNWSSIWSSRIFNRFVV